MADDNDIARIEYVINNYDTVELLDDVSREYRDKNQRPAPIIKYSKRIDGTYYIAEAVPDTKKHQLPIISAYKSKAAEQQMGAARSHDPNVRNASADTASADSIAQSTENSNPFKKNNTRSSLSGSLPDNGQSGNARNPFIRNSSDETVFPKIRNPFLKK